MAVLAVVTAFAVSCGGSSIDRNAGKPWTVDQVRTVLKRYGIETSRFPTAFDAEHDPSRGHHFFLFPTGGAVTVYPSVEAAHRKRVVLQLGSNPVHTRIVRNVAVDWQGRPRPGLRRSLDALR